MIGVLSNVAILIKRTMLKRSPRMMHAWIGPIMRTKGDLALGDAQEMEGEGRFASMF